jgi:hypothetical protein
MSNRPTELKAALPADFSGEPSDAIRWIKAMKAYFRINAAIYTDDEHKVMTTLNKMSKGRGISFSEMWYDKMSDTNLPSSDKTFDKFASNFESTFFPFDTKATARFELTRLAQRSLRLPDGTTDDGFQKYITDFQNLSAKAGITDDVTLIDQFSLGIDHALTSMVLSMASPPTTISKWIEQVKTFHAQKMRILALKKGRFTPSASPRPTRDPDAMEVDSITLSKLTPAERAKCIREGRCFRCRDKGHNAPECPKLRKSFKTPARPQNLRSAETASATPTSSSPSVIETYVNSLKTQGKNEAEILQVLQMCYEEPKEEIACVSTSDSDF